VTTAAPAAAPPLGVRDRRWPRRAAAVAAGLLIAASVPPIGFWPLGVVGVALLGALLRGVPARERVLVGFLGGLGLYGVTISWFAEFNLIGAVASMGVEAAFLGGAAALTPPGRGRRPAWVGALVLQDWARTYIPFGGVPLGGIPLGQAAGPLAPVARLLGQLGLTGATALAAVALEAAVVSVARGGARWKVEWGVVAVAFPVALAVAGAASPSGHVVGSMRIALVQGGGQRGLRAVESNAQRVLDAQFQASGLVTDPVDVIVWPEDVIALTGPVAASPEAARVAAIARTHHATVLAGVTEDVGTDKFRNAIVVWSPDGTITGRYDKVHRVPFGEYVPGRWLVRHIVSLGVIPRDAIPGHGSGEVATGAGPVGIVISYEIFFSARARSAIAGGGQVLIAPTNTASYTTTQVPAAEIAADRIRAWETGRDVVMVAPTGWSAVMDSRGHVLRRSHLVVQQVIEATVPRRTGRTPYVRYGDLPTLVAAAVLLGAGLGRGLSDGPGAARVDRAVNPGEP
jgi:apolipoprotein N-acyltransferase